MANARELLNRRQSVENTCKITRTMELVASAKMKKAQDAAEASRPYTDGLKTLVRRLAADEGHPTHPLMEQREVKTVAILVAASDRGLCGAFNTNLVRKAIQVMEAHKKEGRAVEVISLSKKASSLLAFMGVPYAAEFTGIAESPKFHHAQDIFDKISGDFLHEEVDRVELVYSSFESIARQSPSCMCILPAGSTEGGDVPEYHDDFLYHPDTSSILSELIPQTVRTAVFSALLQTAAGEQSARRMAMKNATDAAGDIIKAINRQYNRARQGKITQEIAEIVGAVEAMA